MLIGASCGISEQALHCVSGAFSPCMVRCLHPCAPRFLCASFLCAPPCVLPAAAADHIMLSSLRQISDVILVHNEDALLDPIADDSVGFFPLVRAWLAVLPWPCWAVKGLRAHVCQFCGTAAAIIRRPELYPSLYCLWPAGWV